MKCTILLILCCVYSTQLAVAQLSCGNCYILTDYIENGNATYARELSLVNSAEYLGIPSSSGFITVKKEYNNNLFYWFFPAENASPETPWIIWLQGGPGYSSMVGLFDIIGPIKIEGGKVTRRNLTWASNYSLLFLDNPVGAGFSFTDDERGYPDNEDDVGDQMLQFLIQFLKMFPELREAPLFIVGQSYAGKYVPALGIQIHRYNQKQSEKINLRGIAIGNGLIDLRNVMHYSEFCYHLGLLDGEQIEHVKKLEEQTVEAIDQERMVDAANKFNETIEYIKKESGVIVYNFLKDSCSPSVESFESYITSQRVRELIHVGNATFDYNNQHVYYKMLPDFANSTKPFVEELLAHYGVMSYTGQLDVILPYSLIKRVYASLAWPYRDQYVKAPRRQLKTHNGGCVVGYKKAGGNFIEILVRGAGHAAAAEQPVVTKFIIDEFINQYKKIAPWEKHFEN